MRIKVQKGVGLVEVLVTALILSTSLLAIASLQTRALQYNSSAYLRSQANILASDVFDRIRAGSDSNVLFEPDVDELAKAQLPAGEADLDCVARMCTFTVTWVEPTANQAGDDMEKSTFTYVSRI